MSKNKELGRVSDCGLVNQPMDWKEGVIEKVPLYYCHGKWFGPNNEGGFSSYKDSAAGVLLGQHGFSRSQKNEHGNSPADVAMLWLMQNISKIRLHNFTMLLV